MTFLWSLKIGYICPDEGNIFAIFPPSAISLGVNDDIKIRRNWLPKSFRITGQMDRMSHAFQQELACGNSTGMNGNGS